MLDKHSSRSIGTTLKLHSFDINISYLPVKKISGATAEWEDCLDQNGGRMYAMFSSSLSAVRAARVSKARGS